MYSQEIFLKIIFAQIASDRGKGELDKELISALPERYRERAKRIQKSGYKYKDNLMMEACQMISSRHPSDVRFFVVVSKDPNTKYLVYFDFRLNGQKYQVSFHTPYYGWGKWVRSSVPSRGHWDHKSSRETCMILTGFMS